MQWEHSTTMESYQVKVIQSCNQAAPVDAILLSSS